MKTTSDMPCLSVVIPCYNEANYIGGTLQSLRSQETSFPFEVIVVDNNCTDGTIAIAEQYGARIVSETKPGVCAARQAGTAAARGAIIVSTDADTLFAPQWLERIYQTLTGKPGLVALGGPCRYYDGPWWGKIYTHVLFGWSYAYYRLTGRPYYITATNIAFKKAAWGGYDLSLTQGGDELALLHQLRTKGKVGFTVHNATYTSGRRLERGLLYNVFVSFLYYYLGAYYLNTLFGRRVIGAAPVFRKSYRSQFAFRFAFSICVLLLAATVVDPHFRSWTTRFMWDNSQDVAAVLKRWL